MLVPRTKALLLTPFDAKAQVERRWNREDMREAKTGSIERESKTTESHQGSVDSEHAELR